MNVNYIKNVNFPQRYIDPEKLFLYLRENYRDYICEIGKSTNNLPIYLFSIGNGNIKVLGWSQMHGNESNGTHAMLDLLLSLEKNEEAKNCLWNRITLDFIFMLNPDGSKLWIRKNALDIDINRDFLEEISIEMKILKQIAFSKKYDYALNLHEQRTIFSTDGIHPATLSFLAPSENKEREITPTRKKAMAVISQIYRKMSSFILNNMARYTDEFYPTSSGDNLTKEGIAVILYEGGFFLGDYSREKSRMYYTYALFYGLMAIAKLNRSIQHYENYFDIPENIESHFDIIYRRLKYQNNIIDVALQYKEVLGKDGTIQLIPYIVQKGFLDNKKAWKEIDCKCNSISFLNQLISG